MSATTARDRAVTTARTDARAARVQARRIADPWFRCQALAWAARAAADADFDAVAEEAARAAQESEDPYRRVGACAWPVRAMVERGRDRLAARTVAAALADAVHIPHPVRRGDALFLLWQAAVDLKTASEPVLTALVAACAAMDSSWKGPYLLRDLAQMLARTDPIGAHKVIAAMPQGRFRRSAERRVQAGDTLPPRAFFW